MTPKCPITFEATSSALCVLVDGLAVQIDGPRLSRHLQESASLNSEKRPYAAVLMLRMAQTIDHATTSDTDG